MDLNELRSKIDDLDSQIVKLLNERADVVVQVGALKNAQKTPVYAPDREHQILERIQQLNPGPLPNRCLNLACLCGFVRACEGSREGPLGQVEAP